MVMLCISTSFADDLEIEKVIDKRDHLHFQIFMDKREYIRANQAVNELAHQLTYVDTELKAKVQEELTKMISQRELLYKSITSQEKELQRLEEILKKL